MTAPLDAWLREATGLAAPAPEAILAWQMARLRETLAHARANGPLYRESLASLDPESVRTPGDLGRLPRTTDQDLRRCPEALLCVSQDEVARVVTLRSSGTTGPGKRVFYAAEDLERTVDYFHHGMRLLIEPGQAVLILLPGERPDSVGQLLARAVERLGGRALIHGPLADPNAAPHAVLDRVRSEPVACLAGAPAQLNVLAACWIEQGLGPEDSPVRTALLCWDAAPLAVCRNLGLAFGCRAHRHWGMVETGLGGAVECSRGSGPHLREADLLVEIADPDTGRPLPEGDWGEITVTTLRNRAMPLVRYRTGDLGRILPGTCACGSPLRRLDPDIRRLKTDDAQKVTLHELNETLYGLAGLADFTAGIEHGRAPGETLLRIGVCAVSQGQELLERARLAVLGLESVRRAKDGSLRVDLELLPGPGPAEPGLGKRRLRVGPGPGQQNDKEKP